MAGPHRSILAAPGRDRSDRLLSPCVSAPCVDHEEGPWSSVAVTPPGLEGHRT